MAMINCPECGKEVSDKADKCPNCGYPLTKSLPKENSSTNQNISNPELQKTTEKKKESACGIIGMIIALFALFGANILLAVLAIILCIGAISSKNKKSTCGAIGMGIGVFALIISILAPQYLKYVQKSKEEYQAIQNENQVEAQNDNLKEEAVQEEKTIVETNDVQSEQSENRMQTGTYIVGEDIESGKYDFQAIKGTGSFKIYLTYEDYKSDEYGYDAFRDFDMLADGSSAGLMNKDVRTDIICNIRLEDDYCIVVDKGLELEYNLSSAIENNTLSVGTYIVGEDIQSGKYDFTATRGSGSLKLYNSYDEYLKDTYGYRAFEDYDIKEENASVGLLNEDVYSQSVNNIRLEDGQCLVIEDGLKIKYAEK